MIYAKAAQLRAALRLMKYCFSVSVKNGISSMVLQDFISLSKEY